jgi:hypothetical protein
LGTIYLRDQSDEGGVDTLSQFTVPMKLRDKAHNIVLKVLPEVQTWDFITVAVPHGYLHFNRRERFG